MCKIKLLSMNWYINEKNAPRNLNLITPICLLVFFKYAPRTRKQLSLNFKENRGWSYSMPEWNNLHNLHTTSSNEVCFSKIIDWTYEINQIIWRFLIDYEIKRCHTGKNGNKHNSTLLKHGTILKPTNLPFKIKLMSTTTYQTDLC